MLVLPRAARGALVAHAREGAPEEVCGVLGGEVGVGTPDDGTGGAGGEGAAETEDDADDTDGGATGETARVVVTHRATNVAEAPRTRYEMAPEEQLRLLERVEREGHEIVGFYHSHPTGPPRPSPTDAALAGWPGYRYVVVVPGEEPFVGSWRWTGDRFEREAVRVLE